MTLQAFVLKLGLRKVAKRLGITVETLQKWLRRGPSARGAPVAARAIKRHLAGVKGHAAKVYRRAALLPVSEMDIPAYKALPKSDPHDSPEVQRYKQEENLRPQVEEIKSTRTTGMLTWLQIGQDVREVDSEDLAASAWMIHDGSGLTYCSVKFLFMRYIPFNPMYTGGMLRKQGKWVDHWMTTPAEVGRNSLTRSILFLMSKALKWAETRIIFLEMIGVATFNFRDPNKTF